MRNIGRWMTLGIVALAAGCSGNTNDSDAGDGTPALDTNIEVTKADAPARYSAALPTTDAGLQRWLHGDETLPPYVHVKDLLLNGDSRWFEKLATAAKSVRAVEGESWASRLSEAFQYEVAGPGFCQNARAVMQAPESTLRRALVGTYASHCATDEELMLIVRADTPDSAVLEYFGSFWGSNEKSHPYHARFAAAARATIFAAEFEGRGPAFALARHPDPQARAVLHKILAEIDDPQRADQIALAFHDSKNPKDKALATAACQRNPDDAVCRNTIFNSGGTDHVPGEAQPDPPKPSPAAVKAVIDRLAAAGFTKVSAVDPGKAETVVADQLLMIAGYAYWFDVETGMYPNNHDSLMRQLAALVSPELDDAIFEETAPDIDDESGPYTLTVYTAGKRLRAEARNLGDWYDVEAVLNLMNAAAKERGSKVRFVGLASEDQTMAILGAPGGAIARAIQRGLIEIGDSGEAEKAGKNFEEKVMEAFKN